MDACQQCYQDGNEEDQTPVVSNTQHGDTCILHVLVAMQQHTYTHLRLVPNIRMPMNAINIQSNWNTYILHILFSSYVQL